MTSDPLRYFRIEAREIADQLGQAVLELDRGAPAEALVRALLRQAHTLKGAARVVKQPQIAELAHGVEDLLDPYRALQSAVPRDVVAQVLAKVDAISERVAALVNPQASTGPVPQDLPAVSHADSAEVEALLESVNNAQATIATLEAQLAGLDRIRRVATLLSQAGAAPSSTAADPQARQRALAEDVRVELTRVHASLSRGAATLQRELGRVRDNAARLQLVPVRALVPVVERTAHDAAAALGKRVRVEVHETRVRLEPVVLTAVQRALVQLVRNAVAHGIESPEQRIAAGKPAEGQVRIEVFRRGSRVLFSCADDGRGVDLEAVRVALTRRGMRDDQVRELAPETLLGALTAGGLSTSGVVTPEAGRGVGLDVVRHAMEGLGGRLAMKSERGCGAVIEMDVPVSRSSLEVIVADCDGRSVAIPRDSVRTCVRASSVFDDGTVVVDDAIVPVVVLSSVLERRRHANSGAPPRTLVVLSSGGESVALAVDRLVAVSDIVVQPLPRGTPSITGVLGAYTSDTGEPRVVVDPNGIMALARGPRPGATRTVGPTGRILIIDDSLTTRMLEQSILESAGFEVGLATSGEEALSMATSERFALFLVDIEMPGMDGFTFIERAAEDPRLAGIPAILVSSRSSADDRKRGEEVGARAYVVKSEFDQAALLHQIQGLVRP